MTATLHVGHPGGIDGAIADALSTVDEAAGLARARYITTAPGQAETYMEKHRAALAYRDAGTESVWLTVDGLPVAEAAALIIETHALWQAKGAEIERTRMQAKQAIRASASARQAIELSTAARSELAAL